MKKKVGRHLTTISELLDFLGKEEVVYLQVHDFPDADAVASAFALQNLFQFYAIASQIISVSHIREERLNKMIADLDIMIQPIAAIGRRMRTRDKIILVDGCKDNANVTDLVGDEVAIIDHHLVTSPEDVEFADIRPDLGACSSLVGSYFLELGVPIPPKVATALMIGIGTDTALFTRGVSAEDLKIYHTCFPLADIDYVMSILRNPMHYNDLEHFSYLIKHLQRYDNIAFCHFPQGCGQNLLAIMATFVLSLMEIDLAVLSAINDNQVHFSVRNESGEWNAAQFIQEALGDIGFGGGHQDMAGGLIPDAGLFDKDKLYAKMRSLLNHGEKKRGLPPA
jgi:nanoRNase/pAp phosphatase (c-di-AMP/oligoRNAs hydrolase)